MRIESEFPIYIFDIDGTIADITHRIHHVQKQPKDWDAFFAAQHLDTVIEPIVRLINAIFFNAEIILLTGRERTHKEITESWLAFNRVNYDRIIMRPKGNRENDTTLKVKLLNEFLNEEERKRVVTIFEDRKRVVDSLRAAGYHVCHVAEGNF